MHLFFWTAFWLSPPAVSRNLTGRFAAQNIGEVSRSDGGVKPYNQKLLCYLFQPLSEETGMCVPTRDLSLKFMLTPRIFYWTLETVETFESRKKKRAFDNESPFEYILDFSRFDLTDWEINF